MGVCKNRTPMQEQKIEILLNSSIVESSNNMSTKFHLNWSIPYKATKIEKH